MNYLKQVSMVKKGYHVLIVTCLIHKRVQLSILIINYKIHLIQWIDLVCLVTEKVRVSYEVLFFKNIKEKNNYMNLQWIT